jgi:uncharacterized protein YjbJ (UPF0337 family)
LKHGVGGVIGNPDLEVDGINQEAKGGAQKALGDVKREAAR